MSRVLALAVLMLAFPAQALVTIVWVTVGDVGNGCDTQSQGCFGAVSYEYRIGTYEVTNAQYAEFLNAVAATDPNGLYYPNMASPFGGITRSGSPESYSYSVNTGRGDMPVPYVSFFDGARFANWLHNGQPTGVQDSTTTEDGAYDMSLGSGTVRKAGAEVFLPSEDEWYKAAYYKGGGTSAGYWDYPAGSDTQTTCTAPGATANTADCSYINSDATDVGSYTRAASPAGTFDQGASLWEWNDTLIGVVNRGMRGGSFIGGPGYLAASNRLANAPRSDFYDGGIRVASPAPASPSVPSIAPLGIAILCTVLGLAGLRKLRE